MVQFLVFTVEVSREFSPAEVGLPPLFAPALAPKGSTRRQVLVVITHVSRRRADGHVSQREIQELLNRSGRAPIVKYLHSLRVDGFLARYPRKAPVAADVYYFGRRVSSAGRREWLALAENLFGKNGLCKGLFGRPASFDIRSSMHPVATFFAD